MFNGCSINFYIDLNAEQKYYDGPHMKTAQTSQFSKGTFYYRDNTLENETAVSWKSLKEIRIFPIKVSS